MSLRKAIDQHCRDCIFDPTWKGSWRKQVEDCTATKCALYPKRPMTSSGQKKRAKEAKND